MLNIEVCLFQMSLFPVQWITYTLSWCNSKNFNKNSLKISPKEGKTTQWPKGQTMIYKTLHKKLKIEQHKPHLKLGVNSGGPEG